MIRTAVFGGSFNPVHYGHINLAKEILRQDLADEVWLMVSPRNPLKQQADLLDEQTRLRLARLALAAVPGVFASDDEFSLPRPSYTWKTLDALRSKYPDLTGKVAENALVAADITVNKNMVPFDSRSAFQTSGIRLGTPAITTRGAKEDLMELIAELIEQVLNSPEDPKVIAAVRARVNETMEQYPLFYDYSQE